MVGPFADELMTAHLTEDSWRHRHDSLKVTLVNMCNEARVPIDCEVFGIFRDLIPAALTAEGGELQFGWKRAGLGPYFRLRFPTAAGPLDPLGLALPHRQDREAGGQEGKRAPRLLQEAIGEAGQVAPCHSRR